MENGNGNDGTSVLWNEWEPETLARAAEEGKLIFLDIGATWCHWCRVLDMTSLADPRVVRMLNEDYISVRVDTDRRPDINERYNQGGWPSMAVLLPDGKLLTGATYLPADALAGVLEKCRDFYRQERAKVDDYMRANESVPDDPSAPRKSAPESPRPEDLSLVRRSVLAMYDSAHPGFFKEPKFPVAEILAFLRDAWLLEGDAEMGDILLKVLRTMGASGLFDPVEGGFFRYATRRDWTAPHYEKVLSDNAELLSLYASAYGKTGDACFAGTARDILRFLFGRLHDPGTGAFFGSQCADETYYPLPADERARRLPPSVDRTIFSEYNAKTVSALAAAHRAFGPPRGDEAGGDSLLGRAERLADFLRESLWDRGDGQARFLARPGVAGDPPCGLLADNAAAAAAHLDLFDATGKEGYLRSAEDALSFIVGRLYREGSSGFADRIPAAGDIGHLSVELYPFGANATAAMALMRFARAAARDDLFGIAVRVLCGLSAEADRRGAFAAPYGSALLLYRKAN
ncbi:MAG: DUF255 domain-containing protein [Thermodesulfobacteriota bacterium]